MLAKKRHFYGIFTKKYTIIQLFLCNVKEAENVKIIVGIIVFLEPNTVAADLKLPYRPGPVIPWVCAACVSKIPRDRAQGKTAGQPKILQKNTAHARVHTPVRSNTKRNLRGKNRVAAEAKIRRRGH